MKGIALNDDDPLHFDSIVDTGHSQAEGAAFGAETHKLLDYFNTCLAIRDDDAYVNLSPHKDAKLLGESLAGTRLGAALLEFDYRRIASTPGSRKWADLLDGGTPKVAGQGHFGPNALGCVSTCVDRSSQGGGV